MATPWLPHLLFLFTISFLVTQETCGKVHDMPVGPQSSGEPVPSSSDPFPFAKVDDRTLELKETLSVTLHPVEPPAQRELISIAQPATGFEEPQPDQGQAPTPAHNRTTPKSSSEAGVIVASALVYMLILHLLLMCALVAMLVEVLLRLVEL